MKNSFSAIIFTVIRLTIVQIALVILFSCSCFAHSVNGQVLLEKKVSVHAENTELKKVLQSLQQQTGARFIFGSKAIRANRKISVRFDGQQLGYFIETVLKPLNIGYKMVDEQQILLYPENLPSSKTNQQVVVAPEEKINIPDKTITGNITDDKGAPLSGASITVKGVARGTITDEKGNFSLLVKDADQVLVISNSGYENQEVKIGAGFIRLGLKPLVSSLEDAVVVGYGVQKKATVTGAISQISGRELLKAPVSNITNSLIGKVTGLTSIAQNGQPGKQVSDIFIRGKSTFSGDPSAIVVIDGVERSDFGNIDPNEIESISVLKDASSTAIFGVRGANGVIIVTTRTGTESKPKVSYSGNISMNIFTNQPKILDAYNSAVLKNEGQAYDGLQPLFTEAELQKFKDGSDPVGYPNVDWSKVVTRPHTVQTQHNINVSGGTKFVKYFASVGYLYENGVFKDLPSPYNIRSNNDYKRYNFRSNLDFNISKDLQIGVKLGARTESIYEPNNSTLGSVGRIFYQIHLTPSFAYPITLPDGRVSNINGVGPNSFNPVALLTRSGYQLFQRNNFQSTINLDYKLSWLTAGLKFISLLTFDNDMNTVTTQNASFASYNIDRKTKEVTLDPVFRLDNPLGPINVRPNTSQGGLNYNINLGFDYSRTYGGHAVTGLVRFTRRLTQVYATGSGALAAPNANQGLVGRTTYNYKGKYLAEFSAGYNGSENFPKGRRYGFFPAFGAGWVVSNEPFFEKSLGNVVEFFKIKSTYGFVGNDRIGGSRFIYLNDYAQATGGGGNAWSSPNTRVQFGDPQALVNYPIVFQSLIGNPFITWEKSLKRNIGFESNLFRGGIILNVDFFDEQRSDILLTRQSGSVTYGSGYPVVNFGKVNNKGYEAELKLSKRFGKLTAGFTTQFNYAINTVIERDEPASIPEYQKSAGHSIDRQLGYLTAGYYNSEADIANWPVNRLGKVRPGDLKFVDVNKDGVVDALDRTSILNPTLPRYTYSFEPRLEWQGISLSVLFQGTAKSTASSIMTFNWFEFMLERWTPERYAKGEKISWPAVPSSYSSTSINFANDVVLSDNSYLKIRNAELAWQLPRNLIRSMKLSGMRVYLTGQNLVTWTNYKYYMDPEVTIGAGDYRKEYAYPSSRRFNFGVNVQF